ncbi:MAG: winged helix-turn-helix domain-containing protein [Candidatus Heimdallarchaeaceae archaeon]
MNTRKRTSPEIWKALSNSIRRELLCFIGDKRIVSFTDIQERFQMKVGTLYHHLDTLGELISQDAAKKYFLTEKGKRAYGLIEDELDVSAPSLEVFGKFSFLHSIFLRGLFKFINADPIRSLGFSLLIFVALTTATYFLSSSPIFLFPSYISPDFFAPVFFLFSTLITYAVVELFSIFIFKRKKGKLALFQAVIISQIPLIILSTLESLVFDFDYTISPLQMSVWVIVLLFFVQLIFTGLLLESIIVIKELRAEKAGVIALLTTFVINGIAFVIMNLLEFSI